VWYTTSAQNHRLLLNGNDCCNLKKYMQPNSQIATSFLNRALRLCVFAVMISFSAVQAQTVEVTKSTRIEKIEGKEYYIHTVIKGQTLYAISKAYNILISNLVFENEEAIDGIKPGMELRIPVSATAPSAATPKDKPLEINGRFRIHEVEKGQTMYAVSRLYNLSVYEIMQANPGISETLSLGQKLNIPVAQLIKSEETVFTSVNIENLKDSTSVLVDPSEINVVLLLPLYLDENKNSYRDTVATSSREDVYAKSLNGLEFYEGALLAVDSLSKRGIKATVYTYDVPDDATLTHLLTTNVLKNADIIIGPFHGKRFEMVAGFAKENKIVCVSPVLKKSEIAQDNPYVSRVLPSEEIQIRELGDYIGRWNCKKNIIVMYSGNEDSVLIEKLKQGIKSRCDSAKIHFLNTKGRGVKLVDSLIQPGVENIIMAFSHDESYVSRLVLLLEKKNAKQRVVTLFGLDEWQDFENIEVEYFQNLNLHLPVDLFVDYSKPEVKNFLLKFRDKYLAEPGKYGYLGYDVMLYYVQMIQKFGNDFYLHPETIHANGVQSSFDFKKLGAQGGLENQNTFILNYTDYRLVKVN
jgi:LysM repeat protein/ABC-type branched-subunit amino acid transport system substrate-binding protein